MLSTLHTWNLIHHRLDTWLWTQGYSTFIFGIDVQPEWPNREACEWTTAEFGILVN